MMSYFIGLLYYGRHDLNHAMLRDATLPYTTRPQHVMTCYMLCCTAGHCVLLGYGMLYAIVYHTCIPLLGVPYCDLVCHVVLRWVLRCSTLPTIICVLHCTDCDVLHVSTHQVVPWCNSLLDCYTRLYYVMLCYAMLCCDTVCVMFSYAMWCCIALHNYTTIVLWSVVWVVMMYGTMFHCTCNVMLCDPNTVISLTSLLWYIFHCSTLHGTALHHTMVSNASWFGISYITCTLHCRVWAINVYTVNVNLRYLNNSIWIGHIAYTNKVDCEIINNAVPDPNRVI